MELNLRPLRLYSCPGSILTDAASVTSTTGTIVHTREIRQRMAVKQLRFGEEARRALALGADAVANAVKVTLGPKGRTVMLDKQWGSPTITKDGVTVANEIGLEDPFQNVGAQLVKEVASKTN